jgi:hypothetical protein
MNKIISKKLLELIIAYQVIDELDKSDRLAEEAPLALINFSVCKLFIQALHWHRAKNERFIL